METKLSPTHCKDGEKTNEADDLLKLIKYEEESDEVLVKIEELEEETGKQAPKVKKAPKIPKLFGFSKKISNYKAVDRYNADKFVKFFKKWKELKKVDKEFKQQTKFWFSSFNKKLNKTYIYRDFFDSVRIHFRLAVDPSNFSFDNLKGQGDWSKLFLNLTDYLRNQIFESENLVDREKKSQVVPVWIDGVNSFQIEEFQKYS